MQVEGGALTVPECGDAARFGSIPRIREDSAAVAPNCGPATVASTWA
jgi:hypothetical protein